ncbi:MAG TPA: bifunctional riboflavin kinase/FAD synthetase [Acidimicrobiia bacterium]|jgi:riboflavin kinase/FMN adenylyltransferase
MQLVDRVEELASERGTAVTIGVYDGVHLGHQKVLQLLRDLANARDLDAVCVTFDRHPAEVVRPESAPKLLTTLEQKLELLDATGLLDRCYVLHFDEARSREAAEDFVREVLVDGAGARLVAVGNDFHFGRNRGGNVALLEQMGAELGFVVVGLGLEATADGVVYSSTHIRALLGDGDVSAAAALLGRPHEARGRVEVGDRRGRELGFPTANVMVPTRICLPADGIYAGTFLGPDDVERVAAISLGRRPTFYEHADESLLEAFVLDFDGDLYGEDVTVRFLERLRGEERFDTVEALVEQMHRDVAATRRVVSGG